MSRISVHAVPQILARARPSDLASSLVAELARAGARGYSGAIDVVLATMACHGSIRAGDRVSAEQARELLAALASVDLGGYCPHGRPVVMRLPYRELEHRVGRR
jgi:DNA mismatch repair protein MutL